VPEFDRRDEEEDREKAVGDQMADGQPEHRDARVLQRQRIRSQR
jgi:hypothetical protein